MSLLAVAGANSAVAGGYDIDNSLALKSKSSEYLSKTFSSGNNKTWTYSCWVKKTELVSSGDGATLFDSHFNLTRYFFLSFYQDKIIIYNYNGGVDYGKTTTQVFRDTSAWYHIVLSVDTTDATAADRMKLYVNGTRVTSFSGDFGDFPLNYDTEVNKAQTHYIGYRPDATVYSSYYITETHHIDGQALAASDFGEFDTDTGIWKPKAYTGSYGTNGFYLDFENSASLGADGSGNSNNFTLNNITSADQATDTPTNNFCIQISTASFRQRSPQTDHATYAGTVSQDSSVTNAWTGTMCSFPIFSGKWYWEVKMNQPSEHMCGVHSFIGATGNNTNPYQVNNSWVCYGGGANWISYIEGTTTAGTAETAFSNGTVVGVALDMGGKTLTFYENGGSAGTNLTNIDISSLVDKGDPLIPFIGLFRNAIWTNFGGYTTMSNTTSYADENGYGSFVYQPPTGYYALCTKNLAEFG